ncbi:sortase domain-bontaining protein [Dactylosporangium sp. NPDC048998]|uniref:sortase domain-containing protein n=1 Tax=Dactylosporangium sp. NPDC048998 TaxID=3363976 RepID=UPI00371CC6CC
MARIHRACGPTPGQRGSAVILGHVDSHRRPAVFFRLKLLRPEDRIDVGMADGAVARFAVTYVATYPKSNFWPTFVYGDHGTSALQLVTCGGEFDRDARSYLSDVVVYTALVATVPASGGKASPNSSGQSLRLHPMWTGRGTYRCGWPWSPRRHRITRSGRTWSPVCSPARAAGTAAAVGARGGTAGMAAGRLDPGGTSTPGPLRDHEMPGVQQRGDLTQLRDAQRDERHLHLQRQHRVGPARGELGHPHRLAITCVSDSRRRASSATSLTLRQAWLRAASLRPG